uniref:Uncharacterized protein n=1 Tax=Solanum lycopersicum TaxID=4081 RepID=A0A494G8B0_SOLLC
MGIFKHQQITTKHVVGTHCSEQRLEEDEAAPAADWSCFWRCRLLLPSDAAGDPFSSMDTRSSEVEAQPLELKL